MTPDLNLYPIIHDLKVYIEHFNAFFLGHRTFLILKNDKNYKLYDTVILHEWNPDIKRYTGQKIARNITYILEDGESGLEKDYIIISIN